LTFFIKFTNVFFILGVQTRFFPNVYYIYACLKRTIIPWRYTGWHKNWHIFVRLNFAKY